MHLMFQVSNNLCDYSSPNYVRITDIDIYCSCACQAEIEVGAEWKLQSRDCRNYWNLEVFAKVPRLESNDDSLYKLQPLYFVTSDFLTRPSL